MKPRCWSFLGSGESTIREKTNNEVGALMFVKRDPKTSTEFAMNNVTSGVMLERLLGEIVRQVDADEFDETRDTDEIVDFATARDAENLYQEVTIYNFCKVVETIVDVCCHDWLSVKFDNF